MIKEYTPFTVEEALQHIEKILPGQNLTLFLEGKLLNEVISRIPSHQRISLTSSSGSLTVSRAAN